MGFFDKIQGLLNPAIIEEYDDLYKNHFEAIDKYVRNFYEPRKKIELQEDKNAFLCYDTKRKEISDYLYKDWVNKDYENNTVKLSFKQKEYIVNHKNEILDLYNRFNKYEKATEECIRYYNEYPHAIAYYCVKVLDLYLTSVEMPMYSIDEKGNMDATMFCALMLKNTIKYVGELTFLQKRELLEHKVFFPEREKQLLKEIKDNKICTDFQINILGNEERKKYYKDFLKEHGINNHKQVESKQFCLKRISLLDNFCKDILHTEQIFHCLAEVYNCYIFSFIKYKFKKDNIESLSHKEKQYIIKNNVEINKYIESEAHKFVDEIKKEYPLGTELYEEYFALDDELIAFDEDDKKLSEQNKKLSEPNSIEWWRASFTLELLNMSNFLVVMWAVSNDECWKQDVLKQIREYQSCGTEIKKEKSWLDNQYLYFQGCRNEYFSCLSRWRYRTVTQPWVNNYLLNKFIGHAFWDYKVFHAFLEVNIDKKSTQHSSLFAEDVLDELVTFIINLNRIYNGGIIVTFGNDNAGNWKSYLYDKLSANNITLYNNIQEILFVDNQNKVVVVEYETTKESLKYNCVNIRFKDLDKSPLISYISLFNILDKEEVELDKEEIKNCVSSWSNIGYPTMKCFSMYNYYPTTCDFEATDEEWNIRKLIWNFKANRGGSLSNAKAMREIVPSTLQCLQYFFGEYLSRLTFVCIPASTKSITKLRYEDFSKEVCRFSGMWNGYPHITVLKDKTTVREGGTLVSGELYDIDDEFFKDKYVLLFDDVITRGRSMLVFKQLLEEKGAIIVGGFSIGRTKHERLNNNPIDNLVLQKDKYTEYHEERKRKLLEKYMIDIEEPF